jgi:HEAT repeat protein
VKQLALLGVGAGVLVAAGIWLGHATKAAPAAPGPLAAPSIASAAIAAPRAPALAHATGAAGPAVAPGLAQDLHDRDPKIRVAAMRELVASDARDPATLLAASHDADLGVAIVATIGLGDLYREGQVSAHDMAARITDHALPEKVRVAAMNGFGVIATPEAAALFTELVAHGADIDRRSAAILLQHQAATTAVPALIAALADSDEYVRMNAVESLRSFARGRDFGTDAAAWQRWWTTRST